MRKVVFAAYAGVLCVCALLQPLGHDEATYAIAGRALTLGDPTGYPIYRPLGMQLLAAPGVLLGGSELAMRLVPCLLSALLVLLAARAARRIGSPAWTAIVVATSLVMLRRASELSSDIAACVPLLAAVLVVEHALRSGRRWSLVWLAPLFASAFYLRYGSAALIASIALATVLVFARHWRVWLAPLVAAGALFALLLVPFALHSLAVTGEIGGVLVKSRLEAGHAYVGDGLVYYLTRWWWRDLGPVATLCLLVGAYRAATSADATLRFYGAVSVFTVIALGLSAHGEARYVLLPLVLLVACGSSVIAPYRLLASVVIVATVLAGTAFWFTRTRALPPHMAGSLVAAAAHAPCRVLSTRPPQVGWYANCHSFGYGNFDYASAPTYVVVLARERQGADELALLRRAIPVAVIPGAAVFLVEDPRRQ